MCVYTCRGWLRGEHPESVRQQRWIPLNFTAAVTSIAFKYSCWSAAGAAVHFIRSRCIYARAPCLNFQWAKLNLQEVKWLMNWVFSRLNDPSGASLFFLLLAHGGFLYPSSWYSSSSCFNAPHTHACLTHVTCTEKYSMDIYKNLKDEILIQIARSQLFPYDFLKKPVFVDVTHVWKKMKNGAVILWFYSGYS